MNLDNFLLTPEEATNLADYLIQQLAYKSGSIIEPTSAVAVYVYLVVTVALVVAIAAIYVIVATVIHVVNVYGS
jgi:hypothetical protein